MWELLLILPVCIFSSMVLSSLHFDDPEPFLAYTCRNLIQVFLGALVLGVLVLLATPS